MLVILYFPVCLPKHHMRSCPMILLLPFPLSSSVHLLCLWNLSHPSRSYALSPLWSPSFQTLSPVWADCPHCETCLVLCPIRLFCISVPCVHTTLPAYSELLRGRNHAWFLLGSLSLIQLLMHGNLRIPCGIALSPLTVSESDVKGLWKGRTRWTLSMFFKTKSIFGFALNPADLEIWKIALI